MFDRDHNEVCAGQKESISRGLFVLDFLLTLFVYHTISWHDLTNIQTYQSVPILNS